MKPFNPLWWLLIVALSAGCTSLRKASLASGEHPDKAVAEVSKLMETALQDQVDILADDQFEKGSDYLADARQELKKGAPAEVVLEAAAIAKALFEDASKTAQARRQQADRILATRAAALKAGVRKNPELLEVLQDIDDDLKSDTKQFKRVLSPEDFSEYQKFYYSLEARAVQFRELDGARVMIEQAEKQDADDLAADTLRTAMLDYAAAMNMITQSPRSPDIYNKSVITAVASATLLYDVMNVIMGAQGTPEHIALKIVQQQRALGELNTNVGKLKQNLETTQQSLEEKESKLARASTQVRFQQAMDEAQQMISPDEALVYQQGNKLVFRLKTVNFRTGTASVPETSKELIAKVDAIIKKLDAEKIVVQGHTDSMGSDTVNKRLSTERATAVAKYLSQLRGGYKITYYGFGETHPIASNKTKTGRATNRRVDLVVTVKK
ncbi:MAG: OmpA family protein [Gammaproteobacteria bacterium]|nr:OmpA family protein [Gammaproteobacteria bacterium]